MPDNEQIINVKVEETKTVINVTEQDNIVSVNETPINVVVQPPSQPPTIIQVGLQGLPGPIGPQGPVGPPGTGSVAEHNLLQNLEYSVAGHINFAGTQVSNIFNADQVVSGSLYVTKDLTLNEMSPLPTPLAGKARLFLSASGVSPNRQVTYNLLLEDGSQVIIASLIT